MVVISEEEIDINTDAGESFGRYTLGNDEEVMEYNTSASLACGFHASDPSVMNKTVKLAKENNTAVGAHVSLPDLRGFGRRRMDIDPQDMKEDVIYQIGALRAFLELHDMEMQHVKPHGSLYLMVEEDPKYAEAFAEAVYQYDPSLIILIEKETEIWREGKKRGLNMAAEANIDTKYDSQGNIVIEEEKKSWDPEEVAKRALLIIQEGKVPTVDSEMIEKEANSLCVHGDAPNSGDIIKYVRERLKREGIKVKNLSEIVG